MTLLWTHHVCVFCVASKTSSTGGLMHYAMNGSQDRMGPNQPMSQQQQQMQQNQMSQMQGNK